MLGMLCADEADEQAGPISKEHRWYLGATTGATQRISDLYGVVLFVQTDASINWKPIANRKRRKSECAYRMPAAANVFPIFHCIPATKQKVHIEANR